MGLWWITACPDTDAAGRATDVTGASDAAVDAACIVIVIVAVPVATVGRETVF